MDTRIPTLRHLAYFEALAEMQETDPEWRTTTAGLVVLRLLDTWLEEEGAELVGPESYSFRAARDEVGAVSPGEPIRTLLGGILDGMTDAKRPTMTPIAPRLMAYGRALNLNARWKLATDVYTTILGHANPADDMDVLIDAHMRLGFCLRMQGDFGPAMAAYAEAGRLARHTGDSVKVMRARIGDAKIAIDRGNLPHAEAILDDTIREAERADLRDVRATALHDKAHVAHRRGEYEQAVCLAYKALDDVHDPVERDRVLADIAASFFELGIRSAARDAHLILAATAQEQYLRWVSVLNLLEIAALDTCEPVFEQYRQELADVPLPPMLDTVYHLYTGRGYLAFGRLDAARATLRRAHELAAEHQYNQLLFDAEAALTAVDREEVLAMPDSEAEPSEILKPVVNALQRMRTAAGA